MVEQKKMMNKDTRVSYGGNPLFWIGVAVLVCLIFIAVISALDLKKDSRPPLGGNLIAMGGPGINGGIQGNQPMTMVPGGSLGLCPQCKTTGVPQCFYCGNFMRWQPGQGAFSCPGCGRVGSPLCPSCRIPMGAGGGLPRAQTPGLQPAAFTGSGTGMPGQQMAALAPPPGCATCPTFNQCFPTPAGVQQAAFTGTQSYMICPGCGYSVVSQPGTQANNMMCPRCNNYLVRGY